MTFCNSMGMGLVDEEVDSLPSVSFGTLRVRFGYTFVSKNRYAKDSQFVAMGPRRSPVGPSQCTANSSIAAPHIFLR